MMTRDGGGTRHTQQWPRRCWIMANSGAHSQIWRLVTCVFFYPINPATGFHFMLNCYFLYNYSLRLENDHFKGSPADYCFLLLFNWFCCILVGLFFDLQVRNRWMQSLNMFNVRCLTLCRFFFSPFAAVDGSIDSVGAVHLVPAEQRCNC